jgi:hypothetical protein
MIMKSAMLGPRSDDAKAEGVREVDGDGNPSKSQRASAFVVWELLLSFEREERRKSE